LLSPFTHSIERSALGILLGLYSAPPKHFICPFHPRGIQVVEREKVDSWHLAASAYSNPLSFELWERGKLLPGGYLHCFACFARFGWKEVAQFSGATLAATELFFSFLYLLSQTGGKT